MRKRTAITVCIIAGTICHQSIAQDLFFRWDSIPVVELGDTMIHAWAGGFNNPQFSDIDLDGDGTKDLFVFDRATSRTFTFINNATAGQVDYTYRPEYRAAFPVIEHWALLQDYNCDGKQDLFTYKDNSIIVYRNDYTVNNGLQFTFFKAFIDTFMYVPATDIPALVDIDNDTDLDILMFDPAGSVMFYYENLSFDNYGNCDSLEMVISDLCWGKFNEAFGDCAVSLNFNCRSGGVIEESDRHAGSTILALDLDGDGDKEMIIGDLTCNNAYMLTNGGTPTNALMIAYDSLYPSFNPVELYRFPAVFYEDVNNDGLKDLLAAPNGANVSENFTGTWYLKNTGTSSVPVFTYQQDDFLQKEMIDVGGGSNPAFMDYNNDSLLDLVIGNYGYFKPTGSYTCGLALFENVGTTEAPVFELMSRDYANINSLNLLGIYPAFGDMDDDGDEDMMLGELNGSLYYFENIAQPQSPAIYALSQPIYKGIDIGQFSTPQIVDVNRDGLNDLLVGERSGTINYFENIGTATDADFTSDPTNDFFGGIDVMVPCCTGYSSPFLTRLDTSGAYSLIVGTESGYLHYYTDIDSNLAGVFTKVDTTFHDIFEGWRASVSGGDINGDGAVDLVVGNYGGGALIFGSLGDSVPPYVPPIDTLEFDIKVYPNPARDFLTIQVDGLSEEDNLEIAIYNILGQIVYWMDSPAVFNSWTIPLYVKKYGAGVHFIRINVTTRPDDPDASLFLKFVISE